MTILTKCIEYIRAQGDKLYGDRMPLMSLWQETADQFYPERADFTSQRAIGTEFASNLMTSYPVIMRRDLANTYSSMLRPTAKEWFEIHSQRQDKEDTAAKQYLQWLTKLQKNAMYDRKALLTKATKEGDNDFVTFGQCVLTADLYRPEDGGIPHLLHRNWHLRDCAWAENDAGVIDTVYRKWLEATAIDIKRKFPNTVHADVLKLIEEGKPFTKVPVWHILIPTYIYDGFEGAKKIRQPWVSIFIDMQHDCVLEEVGSWTFNYVVPRWATVSGSQYAHSPATICALPDARLIQAVTLVLLEAGQKAVNPPMIAVEDMIRSDIALPAGGITWVDADYDERLGEVLRPISQDTKGLQFGLELVRDIREQMKDAFYLNKLNLPPTSSQGGGRDMTAYEVAQRVQEFIRNALPLFEPVETEYNGQLCDLDLQILMRADREIIAAMPDSLKGMDYSFVFDSPLHDAVDKIKVGQWQEAAQVIASAQALDPSSAFLVNTKKATRDVLLAVAPADWLNTEDEVEKMAKNAAAAAQSHQLLDMLGKAGGAAKDLAAASVDANSGMEVVAP